MILKTGAIYTLRYLRWKTNYKIYAFIMWPGGGLTKTHLLNLGAKQLNILERVRLIRTIVRLTKIPASSKYDGRLLYKIFKTYLPNEIKKCYRTFFTHAIQSAALINYGLNKKEDFSDIELSGQAKDLYEQAQRDFQVKAMNLYSGRGSDMKKAEETITSVTVEEKRTGGVGKPAVKPATKPAMPIKPITPPSSDDDDFGY